MCCIALYRGFAIRIASPVPLRTEGSTPCRMQFGGNNVNELHRQFHDAGAREVSEIDDMPWGRDFSVKDLDGNQLRFGTPKQAPA